MDVKGLIKSELMKNPQIAQAAAAAEGVQELIPLVTEAPETIKGVVQSAVDEKLAAAGLPTDGSAQSYNTGEYNSEYSNEYTNEAVPEEEYEGAGGGNDNENENVNENNNENTPNINANTLEEIANALENIPNAEGGGEVMYEGYGGEGPEYGVQGGGFQESGLTIYQNQSGGYFVEQPVVFDPQSGGFYIMQSVADLLRAQQGGAEADEFTDPTAEELAAATAQGGARRSRAYRRTHKISGQGIRQMASRRSYRRAGTRKNRRNARRGTRRNSRRNNGNGL